MDKLVGIFNQLGVDGTILHQFIIFFVLFMVLKALFFNKLQFVLEMRENKTTKLDGNANKKLQDAEKLANDYSEKVKEVNTTATANFNKVKNVALQTQAAEIKKLEEELESDIEEKRKTFAAEIESKKANIMKSADDLSGELVNKLV